MDRPASYLSPTYIQKVLASYEIRNGNGLLRPPNFGNSASVLCAAGGGGEGQTQKTTAARENSFGDYSTYGADVVLSSFVLRRVLRCVCAWATPTFPSSTGTVLLYGRGCTVRHPMVRLLDRRQLSFVSHRYRYLVLPPLASHRDVCRPRRSAKRRCLNLCILFELRLYWK